MTILSPLADSKMCTFSPFLENEGESGIRCHNFITAFFLNIFSYFGFCSDVVSIEDHEANSTWYLNRKSFTTWATQHEFSQIDLINKISQFVLQHQTFKKIAFVSPEKFVNFDSLEDFIREISPRVTLQSFVQASKKFKVKVGSISEEETGVIQDSAGSAVGSGENPKGGGLSGAIYRKFKKLKPIPFIDPGQSRFNPAEDDQSKRILHTHAYRLTKANAPNPTEAVKRLKDSYLHAIELFVEKQQTHQQDTFNLCALSASIYGGRYVFPFSGEENSHMDPSITQEALSLAIFEYSQKDPRGLDDKTLKLFYFGSEQNPSALMTRALDVEQALQNQQFTSMSTQMLHSDMAIYLSKKDFLIGV